jgi:2-dehydro-3-deoxygalactonokinase
VRSEGLFAALAPAALPAYLSGLLIGAELAHALGRERATAPDDAPVSIIASPRLAARYQRALELLGQRAKVVAGEPAARGLASIARVAGLLA